MNDVVAASLIVGLVFWGLIGWLLFCAEALEEPEEIVFWPIVLIKFLIKGLFKVLTTW